MRKGSAVAASPGLIRVLLLADSHLGFDLPVRPRVDRRRRGHDFLANYHAALEPAIAGEVDLVVHGGDVFNRSKPLPSLAYQAFTPLCRVADRGIPVFIVPGNHERAHLPHIRFASQPGIHVFDRPRTFVVTVRGTRVALAGFPYERNVRARFSDVLRETAWSEVHAEMRLLCMHQCAEGASVGPADDTFTNGPDVVRHDDVPPAFTAVLSGHIHRHQVLTRDLARRPLPVPVLYPGSVERTAFAETGEPKGFLMVELRSGDAHASLRWTFHELPARPMLRHELAVDGLDAHALTAAVQRLIGAAPMDAVLSVRITGTLTAAHWKAVAPARLRELAPRTMNIEIVPANPSHLSTVADR